MTHYHPNQDVEPFHIPHLLSICSLTQAIQIDRTRGGLVGGFDVTCVAESTGAVINVVLSIPGGVLQAAPAAKAKSS